MSNVEVRYSVYFMKMRERSDTTLRHSAVRYSIFCGSLFKSDPAIEAVDLYKWIHRSTESHIGGSKIQGWRFKDSGFSPATGQKNGRSNRKRN